MQNFRKLRVWQTAMDLTVFTYKVTTAFPASERFVLFQQMRAAAISIPANISEGAGRGTDKDSKRFLQIAHASSTELHSHFLIARHLGFLTAEQLDSAEQQVGKVQGMLAGLMARLKAYPARRAGAYRRA